MAFHTYTEIIEQAASWQATLDGLQPQMDALSAINAPATVFTGCGSPYYLARTAATVYQALTGKRAAVVPASDIWLYPDGALAGLPAGTALFTISRSGETTEVLRAVDQFRERVGGPVLGVTAYPESALAAALNPTLIAQDSQEISLTQTRSFCNMLLAALGYGFASAGQAFNERFRALPGHADALIQRSMAPLESIGSRLDFDAYYFLGGGAAYGLANEGMLKMKEMSLTVSEGYHFMEFRHGPMAMVNKGTVVVGLVSAGAAAQELAVLRDMKALGATIVAAVPDGIAADGVDVVVSLPGDLNDIERLPLYLPVMQLLGYYRTLARGLNPDTPTNLNAVVQLDDEA